MGHFHISPLVLTDLWTLSTGDSARGGGSWPAEFSSIGVGAGRTCSPWVGDPWSKVKEIKTFSGHWSPTPRAICYRSAKIKQSWWILKLFFFFFNSSCSVFLFWKIQFSAHATQLLFTLAAISCISDRKPIEKWAINKICWRVCFEDVRKQWGCWMVTDWLQK